jgi:hypothetical protein
MPLDSKAAFVFSIDGLDAACAYRSAVISAVKSCLLDGLGVIG